MNLVVLLSLALLQYSPSTLATRLSSPEPLTRQDVVEVIAATGQLVVGKSFFTYGGFGGGTITIGAGPRVSASHHGDRLTQWTGVPASYCDGHVGTGELVLEWVAGRAGWQATATDREWSDPRVMDPMFELWGSAPEDVEDLGMSDIDGVVVRGLGFPYEVPPTAQFEAARQSLWLDVRTGLPVRFEIEIEAPEAMDYGYYFAHAPGWTAGPDATAAPDCIAAQR